MEQKSKLGAMTTFFGAVAVAALLVTAISVVDADAAKGGVSASGGKPDSSTAAISVSPNPAPNGITAIVISGSGFKPGEGLSVGPAGVIPWYRITVNGSGGFSFTYTRTGNAPFTTGTYPVQAWGTQGGKSVLKASTTLVVQ
jgi:hypothetical protein